MIYEFDFEQGSKFPTHDDPLKRLVSVKKLGSHLQPHHQAPFFGADSHAVVVGEARPANSSPQRALLEKQKLQNGVFLVSSSTNEGV
jgi:hypothetical protein